jgi:hypothetical protein
MPITLTGSWVGASFGIGRGLFPGGRNSSNAVQQIDYITIATTGNASDFGDLYHGNTSLYSGCASSTRGLCGGGSNTTTSTNNIEYVTIASTGDGTDFGDLTRTPGSPAGALASETRGIWGGGPGPGGGFSDNVIDYVTIASTGNATDFGDLSFTRNNTGTGASTTRGIFAGGYYYALYEGIWDRTIDYITIASTGNATDFGDIVGDYQSVGCSSSTRAVFAGYLGQLSIYLDTIEYITIASTGNAIDFGNLDANTISLSALSSETRGVFLGGWENGARTNTIQYITIATTGDTSDFGDLTEAKEGVHSGISDVHGGLAGLSGATTNFFSGSGTTPIVFY